MLSVTVAITDWRRGWLLAILCRHFAGSGAQAHPRHAVVHDAEHHRRLRHGPGLRAVDAPATRASSRGGSALSRSAPALVFLFLILAAINGLATFGLGELKARLWRCSSTGAPIPAVLLGFGLICSAKNRCFNSSASTLS